VIWRELIDHIADCYFCMVNVKGFNKKNQHSTPISKLQFSFERPVRMLWMHPSLYSTTFPILKMIHSDILQLQQMITCLSIVLVKLLVIASLFIWPGLIRDLNLPKQSSELLASRLHEKHLLHAGTNTTFYRNRKQEFFQFFTSSDGLVYFHDLKSLLEATGLTQ